ncbi:anhydro-N-acetylmuramic acid kinase [Roseateles sp.]|uniref:anhydro-N-acetylmuramic acid kinase n=1 Tax=Roseateles sp. TaxID=1971397 RepID=UPI003948872B
MSASAPTPRLYIGLMSGTSLDGVDGVVFDAERMAVLAHAYAPFLPELRDDLLALNTPGPNELHRAALAASEISRSYADVVRQLRMAHPDVALVCAHGQTVRHRPVMGYTLQLLNGALLAELCGLDVVCDLRSRDVAAGGQGAPLVPAFHRAVFGRAGEDVAVLNLGGISNLSLLHADGRTLGFDTGPGNCLLDGWILRHQGERFDHDGAWGAQGQVLPELLARLLADRFFRLPPPRSTGRDVFHLDWLEAHLSPGLDPRDVQATLCELAARCVTDALQLHQPALSRLVVSGGGARNAALMARLGALLPNVRVQASSELGLPVDQVEAAAFAWLGHRFVTRQPGNLPEVTGAAGLRLLGALYPA